MIFATLGFDNWASLRSQNEMVLLGNEKFAIKLSNPWTLSKQPSRTIIPFNLPCSSDTFQLYTELASGNLGAGSEICECGEEAAMECTLLQEVGPTIS